MDEDEAKAQEEKRMEFHVPFPIILALLAILLLVLFSMFRFPKVAKEYKIYRQSEARIEQGYTSAALNDLYEMAENHPDSVPIMMKLIRLAMSNGYYDMAGYIFETYMTGREVDDDDYEELNLYFTQLENYYATYDAIDAIYNELGVAEDNLEDNMSNLRDELQKLLKEGGMDQAMIHYYIAFTSNDSHDMLEELTACYQLDPEYMDVRVQLGVIYRRLGELDQAKQLIDEALRKDVEDSAAWRGMATIAMLEGNLIDGLEYSQKAYELNPEGTYIRDTYLVALHANNQTEKEQVMKEELIKVNGVIDPDTDKLLKDEITLKEYYAGE
jgi:tetratricopeptide (TPR) repeat protein